MATDVSGQDAYDTLLDAFAERVTNEERLRNRVGHAEEELVKARREVEQTRIRAGRAEEELSKARQEIEVLKGERDMALSDKAQAVDFDRRVPRYDTPLTGEPLTPPWNGNVPSAYGAHPNARCALVDSPIFSGLREAIAIIEAGGMGPGTPARARWDNRGPALDRLRGIINGTTL